jgi:hypothetical protein
VPDEHASSRRARAVARRQHLLNLSDNALQFLLSQPFVDRFVGQQTSAKLQQGSHCDNQPTGSDLRPEAFEVNGSKTQLAVGK